MQTGQRAWELLLQLTPFASISQSPGEGKIARLSTHAWLSTLFPGQSPPARLLLLPAANSPAVVAARCGPGREDGHS